MRNRLLLVFILLGCGFLPSGKAQNTLSCELLQKKVRSAIDSCKSMRVQYIASSSKTYLDYEKDTKANEHLIYTSHNEKSRVQYALIKTTEKTYAAHTDGVWKDQKYSKFVYQVWIDSCIESINIFKQPFENCLIPKDIQVAGTPYAMFIAEIANDSLYIWFNRRTNKLEKITITQKQKKLKLEWNFDLPFEISAPPSTVKKEDKFGFSCFPLGYNLEEGFDGTEPIFNIVDKIPEFHGGLSKMYEMMGRTMHYPLEAREKGIQGKIVISFVVEKDGKMSNYKIRRGLSPECDAEGMRVLTFLSGKWTAGMFRGQKVRTMFTMPLVYKIE